MSELLTAAQMRAIERAAIESGAVTGLELMERAGRGVVDAIFEEWPELAAAPQRAVVLCGPGNNGGDGFVVARLLKDWGWEVEVYFYGDPGKMPPDARVNYERWLERGAVAELNQQNLTTSDAARPSADGVVVDAIFGIGLNRPMADNVALSLMSAVSSGSLSFLHHVALDLPSGICSDSGRELGRTGRMVPALCVTFHRMKLAHVFASDLMGKVRIVDIGLDAVQRRHNDRSRRGLMDALRRLQQEGREAFLNNDSAEGGSGLDFMTQSLIGQLGIEADDPGGAYLVEAVPEELNKAEIPDGHKFTHGYALVLSGPMGRSGAARLAARAALRVGAGLVTVGAPGSAMMECACQLTAIMLRKCDGAEGLEALLEDARINALCLGPGLGLETARELVPVALASGRSCVLDADSLMAFENAPDSLFELTHGNTVLTPHMGEFARLFPDLALKLAEPATKGPAYSKLDATREAAVRAGCTVLLKGPDTVIAAPDGQAAIHAAVYDRAVPWLATAGAGDVLAGLITGLLARGLGPQVAAESAAWLHVEAARSFGPGLIAEDLAEEIPSIIGKLADYR